MRVSAAGARVKANVRFALGHRSLRRRRKIVYALTPPPYLPNVGDHAQVIAIRAWLDRHLPGVPVVEVDKDKTRLLLPALKRLVGPGDVILLHSGGNLGDRGMWSESVRRLVIQSFPGNKVVSMPQTIFFSDTPTGRSERENTRRIYAAHPDLTIMCRDPQSGELAKELFPSARSFAVPDFVLSLPPEPPAPPGNSPKGLLCLRLDDESAFTPGEREELDRGLRYECRRYDTTLDSNIPVERRAELLDFALDEFRGADFVVTDRYHGMIFAVLCNKPCVVLPTVDHKLTSAADWFHDVPFVLFTAGMAEVPAAVDRALAVESRAAPDWNALYFDAVPSRAGLDGLPAAA
jgi:pyruvyl transferase EpsI